MEVSTARGLSVDVHVKAGFSFFLKAKTKINMVNHGSRSDKPRGGQPPSHCYEDG